jgi:hypothetical protein
MRTACSRCCADASEFPVDRGGHNCGVYVLELASFRAHPAHVAALIRRGGPLVNALRSRFPGLRKLQVARMGDGQWLHLGFWDSRESAEAAANEMFDLPEMDDWLAQIHEFAEAA